MRNDFTKRECRIQEQMAEVFQRMAEDSTIEFPKPDLSFMEEGTVPGAAKAAFWLFTENGRGIMYSLCGICCVKRFGGTDQRSGGVCRESGNDFV